MKKQQAGRLTELGSMLMVPAALVGFIRLFEDQNVVVTLIAVSFLSSLVAAGVRRLNTPLLVDFAISSLAFWLFALNRFAADTLQARLLPTNATVVRLQEIWLQLSENLSEFEAPVSTNDAFALAAVTITWLMAFLTDWGAMRLRLPFEPVLPAGLLYIFGAVLGDDNHQVLVTVILATAIFFWAMLQRADRLNETARSSQLSEKAISSTFRVGGVAVAVAAISFGVLLGPFIPGADGDALVDIENSSSPSRQTESPIIDIGRQLGPEQRENVIFTVQASAARYWRTAGLDTYQAGNWTIEGNFSQVGGGKTLSGDTSSSPAASNITQEFQIQGGTNIWVPAAFEPTSVDNESEDITWNEGTDSLTVANSVPSTQGLTYSVESNAPIFTANQLRAVDPIIPAAIAEQYLPLPDIPTSVKAEAERVVEGQTTRFDQVIALQQYFQDFDYSLDRPPAEPGLDPLENFLTQRVGFCQQFAGTFAVMARLSGHPARVATGYTWGTPNGGPDENGLTSYVVRGRQAHAWPEVYFGDLGWVAFEPTPGRGAPDGGHTGLPEQQDAVFAGNATAPETPQEPTSPEGASAATLPTTEPQNQPDSSASNPADDAGSNNNPLTSFQGTLAELAGLALMAALLPFASIFFLLLLLITFGPLVVVALGLLAYLVGAPVGTTLLRERRIRNVAIGTLDDQAFAQALWNETADVVDLCHNVRRKTGETKIEFAERIENEVAHSTTDLAQLAHLVRSAQYSPAGMTEHERRQAILATNRLIRDYLAEVTLLRLWLRLLLPKRLLSWSHSRLPLKMIGQRVETLSAN